MLLFRVGSSIKKCNIIAIFITTAQLLMIIMMMMPLISTQNIYLLKEDRFPFFTIQVFFRKKIEFRGVTILLIVGNLVPFFYDFSCDF